MSKLRLISVNINSNYQEEGDSLIVTTTWQNVGNTYADFDAQIVANIEFCDRQRVDPVNCRSYQFKWSPFPSTDMYKPGEIWSSTGLWVLPRVWGGTYKISISLIGENGKNIAFEGMDSTLTYMQYITDVDFGWGWGRKKLLEQRSQVEILINKPSSIISKTACEKIKFNNYLFNKKYPAICGFLEEEWYNFPPKVTVRSIKDNNFFVYKADNGMDCDFKIVSENECEYVVATNFCSFTLHFLFDKNVFFVEIRNVYEKPGYEFIDINIPSLIQCFDQTGSLLNFYGGGRKKCLSKALPQTFMFHYDTCNAVGICGKEHTFAVVSDNMENVLQQSVVSNDNENKVGVIGAVIFNHIRADKPGMKSILVKSKPLEIHHTCSENWRFPAEVLRSKLPKSYPKHYENTLLYKIAIDNSGQYDPNRPETHSTVLTLNDAKNIIMHISKLSGGTRQVVYLVGWQKGGHDFEYPYPYLLGFNPKCGTIEEFNQMREELKELNVNLSLHDNFDDAYLSDTYKIDTTIIAKDEKGNPWKGWLWAGGMSYIISPTAYLKTSDISERIESVKKDYGIEDTYHLDVLSSEVRRYSFCQDELSSAEDNANAKCDIIDLFNKKGIDITSETLSFPFIGKIGYAQNTRYDFDSHLFVGDSVIPLTTIAFHGVTPYKMGADTEKISLLRSIAAGASCSLEIENGADIEELEQNLLRNIYITSLPMSKLSYKKAIFASVEHNRWEIFYQDDSSVEADFDNLTYTIKNNGEVISKDFVTFMPVCADKYLYYSIYGGSTEILLPENWESVCVSLLSEDTANIISLENGKLKFCFKADTPYILRKV